MLGRTAAVGGVASCLVVLTLAFASGYGQPAAPQPGRRDQTRPTVVTPATNQARSPRNASYTITARLDPASRTLTGEQLLTWRNTSSIPATSLRFHLYYNAWRNTRSTWMREIALAGFPELAERPEADWGWIDVTSLKLVGTSGAPVDVTSTMRFIAPDDGNVDDRTVAEVPLAAPVAPGTTINIQIAWSSRVPRTFARTGAIGNYYFLGQWFPKIGVLQDTGWNCHQFHAATEFFSDFGIYDVKLVVPSGWVVGATGTERGRRDEGDRTTTHHYYAEDVHDFAWTTSPDYVERIRALRPPGPARRLDAPTDPARARRAGRASLQRHARRAPLLRRVVRPVPVREHHDHRPGVAEWRGWHGYPTLFTAGTRWLAPRAVADPEDVTVHEAGHQFWYGVVATNEFEHAWMDEGLNTFSTARTLDQFFGPQYLLEAVLWRLRAVGRRRCAA